MAALCMMTIGAGVIGVYETRDYDWNRVKPVWWLQRQGYGNTNAAYAARSELRRRIIDGTLDGRDVDRLAAYIIVLQGDPDDPWFAPSSRSPVNNWGNVLESGKVAGTLPHARWREYVQQAYSMAVDMQTRPVVRHCRPIPIRLTCDRPRLAPWAYMHFRSRLEEIRVGRHVLFARGGGHNSSSAIEDLPHTFDQIRFSPAAWHTHLPVGRHVLTCRYTLSVKPTRMDQPAPGVILPDDTLWEMELTAPLRIVDAGKSSVALIRDSTLDEAFRQAIAVDFVSPFVIVAGTKHDNRGGCLLVDPIPVDLSIEVLCRAGDREEWVATAVVQAGKTHRQHIGMGLEPGLMFPNRSDVDVIVRSHAAAAENTLDIIAIWDGEILIEDVPLRGNAGHDRSGVDPGMPCVPTRPGLRPER